MSHFLVHPSLLKSPEAVEAPPEVPAAAVARPPAETPATAPALTPTVVHADGRLPRLIVPERRLKRAAFGALASGIAAAFFLVAWVYWSPAHSGVDQNGYLVGGKQFANTLTMKLQPAKPGKTEFDPHQFVGKMWVGADTNTPAERFYPKYPLGLPLLYAITLWIGGRDTGPWLAYWVNPVAMTLAVFGTYHLARRFMGVFASLLALLVFATSVTTSSYTNNPNSHATTLCCVVWGMYLLMKWWQDRGIFIGFAGGFLLGYAATIRYTEGALVLPLAWAVGLSVVATLQEKLTPRGRAWLTAGLCLAGAAAAGGAFAFVRAIVAIAPPLRDVGAPAAEPPVAPAGSLVGAILAQHRLVRGVAALGFITALILVCLLVQARRRRAQDDAANWMFGMPRAIGQGAVVCLGWLLPVGILLGYNWLAMGTLTGYDATNESVGFSWNFFADNWRTMLSQMNNNGLVFVCPIAVAGLIAMAWWNWRTAVLMWLWTAPCLLIYTFYYWGPDGVSYLRFVVTVFPALCVAAFWLMSHLSDVVPREPARMPPYLLVLVLTFAGIGVGWAAYYGIRLDFTHKAILTMREYFAPELPATETWIVTRDQKIAKVGFYAGVVMFAVFGAAVSAAFFLRRSIVPTLAAGAIAFLAIAVQAADSAAVYETDSLNRNVLAANAAVIKSVIPPGSVVVCRDEGLLHHLAFADDYVLYAGWTFDRGAVNNWSREETLEPVLLDPARGKALFERVGKFEQAQLDDQAREMVVDASNAKLRVFVIEPMDVGDTERRRREKKDIDLPDFVRRYLRPELFDTKRVLTWNVPKVVEDPRRVGIRGPRDRDRDRGRDQRPTWTQIVEVTRKL